MDIEFSKSGFKVSLVGGPFQQDMLDPKPDVPAEIRAEFKPIATSAPGISFDVMGLPPTPEEVVAFLTDAWLAERLLASPHYGECWGRRWLDWPRYADTNGYEKDREQSISPYCD